MVSLRISIRQYVKQNCRHIEARSVKMDYVLTVVAVKEERFHINEELAEKGQVLTIELYEGHEDSTDEHSPCRLTFSLDPSTSQMVCAPRW